MRQGLRDPATLTILGVAVIVLMFTLMSTCMGESALAHSYEFVPG